MMRRTTGLFLSSLILAHADTLVLRNGTSVTGSWAGADSAQVSFLVNNQILSYPRSDVATVTFGSDVVPAQQAQPDRPDSLAAIRQALQATYALTITTADKTDIVTPGAVLVLRKSHLVLVDVKNRNLYQNSYKNGAIEQNAIRKADEVLNRLRGSASASERTFVSGEKLSVTLIEVNEKAAVFTLFSDPYGDTRYGGTLTFPFANPSVNGVSATVAEVFDVQQIGDGAAQQAEPPVTPPLPVAPPPPIAPPPPPPVETKTIKLGQTPEQVTGILGKPDKVLTNGATQTYIYPDMKVIFTDGKVADVQ